mmetsp:Transcript_41911/g.164263  ORF Transcript_41911/g.164263 Transcript_41911/m.164263 type:complete len:92 (+) Transcript_41911:289-564(+)
MAFVNGSGFAGVKVGQAPVVSRRPSVRMSKRTVVSMSSDKGSKQPKPGFTFFNEQLNGRLAMIGFAIGLSTEILNPAHPTIPQQVQGLFGF